ncbi:MAG: cytochrome P450 [Acidobacteria bacterium]|nr:cytochrome P450 [Acidobacteriota bacterium]
MPGPNARPHGPKNPLILGHLAAFRRNPLLFLARMAEQYPDLCYFRLGNQDLYFVNHPDLIKEVLVNQQPNFLKSRILQRSKILLGEGLLTSEGEHHLRQRRLVQPAFHRDRLTGYGASMSQLATRTACSWTQGETRDMHQEMARMTLAIVARTLFSADVDADADAIGESMAAVLGLFQLALLPFSDLLVKLPLPATKRFQKAKSQLDGIIYRLIEERRASGLDTGDLLSMLILAQDEEAGTGGMTDKQVRDEALTLFLAGHETTANALTWAWYLLSQNPTAEAAFHDEIDSVLGAREPQFDDLPQLRYTRGVFAESMRLFPPAWAIGRMTTREISLGGYRVPKNNIVLMSPYITHRDPRYWPEPLEFRPQRFVADKEAERNKFVYYPFGGGSRICIGERFAWMEGVLALAAIGRRWRLQLVPGQTIEPLAQITLRPKSGMKMRIESRVP